MKREKLKAEYKKDRNLLLLGFVVFLIAIPVMAWIIVSVTGWTPPV